MMVMFNVTPHIHMSLVDNADSLLERPTDGREVNCHASAWDFKNGKDFRVKQCTNVKHFDFIVAIHELAHIQYFIQYQNQSYYYKHGANPGFHEAVGDIVGLSIGTPSYFQQLGLLGSEVDINDEETNINLLYNMALKKIAFLPWAYLVDKFRWDLFTGAASKVGAISSHDIC